MYQALYRKYRPMIFGDVVGQKHITDTLRHQVVTGQIAHAYLFTGTRGTGKTTCAKIFSRAVNCLDLRDGEPCNQCKICRGLLEGTLLDVEEIDAASNNSVENIRQIREEVIYNPVAAKYKVYIIDEVHMLSSGAFNALLKTLEEPPAHAIFILATTEIHKVPATILSRCQRFDFQRLSPELLAEQFRQILTAEGKTMAPESIRLVARLADGSSRDGLSILEKVIDLSSPEEVEHVLGVIPSHQIRQLIFAIGRGDVACLCQEVDRFYNTAADLAILCRDLMRSIKDLLIFKTVGPAALHGYDKEETDELAAAAGNFSPARLLFCIDQLQNTLQALSRSSDKRSLTEICLLRLANPSLLEDTSALQSRVEVLENQLRQLRIAPAVSAQSEPIHETSRIEHITQDTAQDTSLGIPSPQKPLKKNQNTIPVTHTSPSEQPKSVPVEHTSSPVPKNSNREEEYRELDSWQDIAASVGRHNRMLGFLLSNTKAVCTGHSIIVVCEDAQDYEELRQPGKLEQIQKALKENRKEGYSVKIEKCSISKYLSGEAIYESIKNSNLFDFDS